MVMTMNELTEEQYFLELWRSCGEAGTQECKTCPVPVKKCEEWNEGVEE